MHTVSYNIVKEARYVSITIAKGIAKLCDKYIFWTKKSNHNNKREIKNTNPRQSRKSDPGSLTPSWMPFLYNTESPKIIDSCQAILLFQRNGSDRKYKKPNLRATHV